MFAIKLDYDAFFLHYIVGNSDGTASVKWGYKLSSFNWGFVVNKPSQVIAENRENYNTRSQIKMKINASPQEIHSKLKIKPNETKIIVEACIAYSIAYKMDNGTSCSNMPASKIFKFHLISPKYTGFNTQAKNDKSYFNSVVVLTPKPGLFNENPPH